MIMKTRYLRLLNQLVAIPSISTDPNYKKSVLKAADWIIKHFKQIGLEHIRLIKTPGHPIVYADYLHAVQTDPTFLIYAHYDVQPPDPTIEWQSNPFHLTIKGGFAYGRGVADNKGSIVAIICALKHILSSKKSVKVNLKVLIEGEEELGSPNIASSIVRHKKLFTSDSALILDVGMPSPNQPAIITGLRGLVFQEIFIKAHDHDLHSGIWGNKTINPVNLLCHIISKIKDQNGYITIPKFYQEVDQKKATTPKTKPSFDINGISGGYQGFGAKTIVPASASAKYSFRLVPHQNPIKIDKLIQQWLYQQFPKNIKIMISCYEHAFPVEVNTNNPYLMKVKKVLTEVFGNKPLIKKSGGTIGAAGDIQKNLKIPLLIFGFNLDNSNLHAPNENIHIPTMLKGIQALKKILT